MYLYVVGGVGNQLFQYAMLHYIVLNSSQGHGYIWLDQAARFDRPFLLGPIVENCSHIKSVQSPYSGFRGVLTRVLRKLRLENIFFKLIIKEWHELTEYGMIEDCKVLTPKNKFWIGYFQNYRYVESVWPVIYPEISNFLDKVTIDLKLPSSFGVMHIRGGDFYKLKDTNGVLDLEYYKKAYSEISAIEDSVLIVITDDLVNAKNIYNHFKPDLVFGPDHLNEWQTLKLVSLAKYVITANSTFSWWGARLALENRAKVFVPEPWFKNPTIEPYDAFYHPNFFLSKSSFMQ